MGPHRGHRFARGQKRTCTHTGASKRNPRNNHIRTACAHFCVCATKGKGAMGRLPCKNTQSAPPGVAPWLPQPHRDVLSAWRWGPCSVTPGGQTHLNAAGHTARAHRSIPGLSGAVGVFAGAQKRCLDKNMACWPSGGYQHRDKHPARVNIGALGFEPSAFSARSGCRNTHHVLLACNV